MVDEPLHLTNAPIVEAVIGIDFNSLPPDVVAKFPLVAEQLAPRYHQPTPIFEQKLQFDRSGVVPPSHEPLPFGVRFVSEDKRYQVQLRRSTFLFSRLAPYESWEVFRQEAQIVWRVFQKLTVAPSPVSLGLRYVNKISFPAAEPIERYLRLYITVPDSPEGGPQLVTGGHLRIQMPIGDPAGLLVVQQVFLPSEAEGVNTIALDNDFRFGALGLSEKEIWDRFDQARRLKNEYFVHFITKELLETYK
jgi:uncharacterized protein (TIGR04255 family)